jgi:type III restriction enzyme
MATATIDRLIINSPYEEPSKHWRYDPKSRLFSLEDGRRPAGYVIATPGSKSFDDPGIFIELPLVNQIRTRVKGWRESGYPGITGITKRLLDHWRDPEEREHRRFFFCQLEAMETLIWLNEAPAADRVGIEIPGDGGSLKRLCSKMATGSGKTVVMAMLIAWQMLNKATYPQDKRFSRYVFVVAPGLTVKSRLQVLAPSGPGNFYDEFNIVPSGLIDRLRLGSVIIRNWHALQWETEEQLAKKKSVDKRGPKSDEAYVREVLGSMANARNLVVINDEAHHAWRVPAESKIRGVKKEDIEEATKWIGGLDRIHKARGILTCYDFSATPFAPSGKQSYEEALFDWIVSDFGLNDAIEAGLVKTPRVVIRDDGRLTREYKSRFYHIYNDPEVKDDINRKAEPQTPLPDLVTNAYYFQGKDWLETEEAWKGAGFKTPPVMISVANRTETAARLKYAFDHKKILIDELCSPEQTLHIDSKVLKEAEAGEEPISLTRLVDEKDEEGEKQGKKISREEKAEILRRMVDTVGQVGKPGEEIQNVISVGMLSEGWDAKTVTHIMGLRAFSSQLLCEQVVGRGLRRTSYEINPDTGLFDAEYVNIFGVPFTFLPHEGGEGTPPPPPKPKFCIEPVSEKIQYEIQWPSIIRIEHVYKPKLHLDMGKLRVLELDAGETATLAELAPVLEGKPDVTKISAIDLEELGRKFRTQKIIFEAAAEIFDQMRPNWKGDRYDLLAQVIRLVEAFIESDRIYITPPLFNQDDLRRRILITLNIHKLVQHIWEAIRFENTLSLVPVFDRQHPIRSTGDMRPWYTGKPCEHTKKSHINLCVFDSTWEASEAFELDRNPHVEAWAKNDHLGFELLYIFKGVVHKFRPDFLIRLINGNILVLETKGRDSQQDKTKREFLAEWVNAVNEQGGFGFWQWGVSRHPKDVDGLLEQAYKKLE